MSKWFEIIDTIRQSKGKEKQLVLEKHKDNDDLFKALDFLMNPRIVTGISKKKFDKVDASGSTFEKSNAKERLDYITEYLKENNTGKDLDVASVKILLNDSDSDLEKEILRGLIIKDLPIGISANTINKIRPNFIEVFKLQKGKLWEGNEVTDVAASLKLDGNSATVFNLVDETYMLSRSGALMIGFDHILEDYRESMPLNYVYQGELIAKNYDNLEHGQLFQLSNGITNSKSGDKTRLQHVVFDIIDADAFKTGKWNVPFNERMDIILENIYDCYDAYGESYANICHVPYYYFGNKIEKIEKIAVETIENGLEGLMLCELSSTYKVGPQKYLQKVKEFKTADVEVIDIKEHVRGNKVGSIVIDWKGYNVSVGGITDDLRKSWWENPNEIVGKLVEIKYFRETSDKNGKLSLRFPNFERVRTDKTEVSYD